jgi:hypothetical protein
MAESAKARGSTANPALRTAAGLEAKVSAILLKRRDHTGRQKMNTLTERPLEVMKWTPPAVLNGIVCAKLRVRNHQRSTKGVRYECYDAGH